VANPDRDTVYSNDGVNRTVYTRESNSTGWFVGIIVALALLAIAYLVFSANSQPSTVDVNNSPTVTTPAPADTLPAPADTNTTPMAPADTNATPMAPADTTPAPAETTPAPADTAPADTATPVESAPAPAESAVSAPAAQ
jgi:preprotein translocase subunit SecG